MTDQHPDGAQWFYALGREQRGPVDEAELEHLISTGEIGPQSLVWREGMDAWAAAQSVLPGPLVPQAWVDGLPRSTSARPTPSPIPPQAAYDGEAYYHPHGFVEAFRTVLGRYAQFQLRARRREYWWWVLFYFLVGMTLSIVDALLFTPDLAEVGVLSNLFGLAVLIPTLAVTARRLHDIGRSGWWQLIGLVPILGWALMIWWLTRPSDPDDNRYGPA